MPSKLGKFTTKYALPLAMGVAVATAAQARAPSTIEQSNLSRYWWYSIGEGTQYIDVATINVHNPDDCGLFCNSMQHIKNMIDNEGLEIVFVQEHNDELDDLADAMGNWNFVEWDRGHGIISKFKLSSPRHNSATVMAELRPGHKIKLNTVHLESRPYPSEDYDKNADATSERNKFINMAFDDHDNDKETRWDDLWHPTAELLSNNPNDFKFGIIAGDFNEPSHKDWAPGHGDRIYHTASGTFWPPGNIVDKMTGANRFPISKHLQYSRFKDSYREKWPNPSDNRGYTYPGGNLATSTVDYIEHRGFQGHPNIPLFKRADRIDRIYYKDNTGNLSVVNSYTMDAHYNGDNPVDKVMSSWDTDHRAVVTRFKYITNGGGQIKTVKGHVDGINVVGSNAQIWGWACQPELAESVDVHLYVGGAAGSGGTMLTAATANLNSEQGVANACEENFYQYRFNMQITHAQRSAHWNQPIYVHAISPYQAQPNHTIGNSGNLRVK